MVPGVVQLGGDPDLLAWDTRVPNALADLRLVPVGQRTCQNLPSVLESTCYEDDETLTCRCGDTLLGEPPRQLSAPHLAWIARFPNRGPESWHQC